jgi:hypothetical protein
MRFVAAVTLAALATGFALAARARVDPGRAAAIAFLDALGPEARAQAQLDFDDPNRLDWHFTPRARRGVSLRDLSEPQRRAAHVLLRSGLSARGSAQARSSSAHRRAVHTS